MYIMDTVTPTNARNNIFNLISEVQKTHSPIHIVNKTGGAVLLSKEDWDNIEETLFLSSIKDSLLEAKNTDTKDCIAWNDLK